MPHRGSAIACLSMLKERRHTDRVLIAAMKCSRGTVDELVEAAVLAELDWRDLLVAADFAYDVHAHETWGPPQDE